MFDKLRDALSKIVPTNGKSGGGELDKHDWYAVLFNTGLVAVAGATSYLLSMIPSLDFGGYDQWLVPVLVMGLKAVEKWAKDNKV